MDIGGNRKDGDGDNTGIIIPFTNARTYTSAMTAVLRLSSSSSGSYSSGGGDRGNNGNNSGDSDDNYNAYDAVICCYLLQRMSEKMSKGGVGRGGVFRRGIGRQGIAVPTLGATLAPFTPTQGYVGGRTPQSL